MKKTHLYLYHLCLFTVSYIVHVCHVIFAHCYDSYSILFGYEAWIMLVHHVVTC